MAHLLDPFTLRSVTLRNRIGVSPMCQYSAEDGRANDWHLVHLGARATGGAGLIIVEATAVEARGRITPGDLGLWDDGQIEPLARIIRFLKTHGAVPGVQLAHAGRKASADLPWKGGSHLSDAQGGWTPVGPSAKAFGDALNRVPAALTVGQIKEVQASFVAATRRALAAGFAWLELHSAHGYLGHSFCSPLSNERTDEYGGSFENRIRFTVETAKQMRAVWPEHLPLAVRISATDWTEGGWTPEDSVALAHRLKAVGVDLIDCSTGGNVATASIPLAPGYQVPFAEQIRRQTGLPTAAVGLITDPAQANAIVQEGRADLVLLARESLRDPNWPLRAEKALRGKVTDSPTQYLRAW
ncbi:NADH:flavin oxidoreductase/NADH oxidase [Opitutaceae bacterium]